MSEVVGTTTYLADRLRHCERVTDQLHVFTSFASLVFRVRIPDICLACRVAFRVFYTSASRHPYSSAISLEQVRVLPLYHLISGLANAYFNHVAANCFPKVPVMTHIQYGTTIFFKSCFKLLNTWEIEVIGWFVKNEQLRVVCKH